MGVSETAKAQVDVKPAPEVDPTEPEEEDSGIPSQFGDFSDDMFIEYSSLKQKILDKETGGSIHDEL